MGRRVAKWKRDRSKLVLLPPPCEPLPEVVEEPPVFDAVPELPAREGAVRLDDLLAECHLDRARWIEEFVYAGGCRSVASILWYLGRNIDERILVVASTDKMGSEILKRVANGLHMPIVRAVFPDLGYLHRSLGYGIALAHLPSGSLTLETVVPPKPREWDDKRAGAVMSGTITGAVIVGKTQEILDCPVYSLWWAREVKPRLAAKCPVLRFQEM